MKKISQSELERYLTGYLAHVELWTPDAGDSFLMLNCREILANKLDSLTDDQRSAMQSADNRALLLADKHYEEETTDVGFLKLTAEVIKGHLHSQAA